MIAMVAGAVGSVALMLRAGRNNSSGILLVMFVLWVLGPFVALALANTVAKRWSASARATLYYLMLVVALGSLAVYGYDAIRRISAKAAFIYLVLPFASWLLMAIVIPIAWKRGTRRDTSTNNVL
jgi:hypothetical protein